jgi:hypothetical protein
MKEIININGAKQKMKNINVVIYGTIRDIETNFFASFTNIEIISKYFNKVIIIILENDSTDKTRQLLVNWSTQCCYNKNIYKHIILKDNLTTLYPLRAHRLAYCRNLILNYIFENNLHQYYEYAIHCDLDDRFWSVDFESIVNCFQYDLHEWDVMTCVNKNRTYYDFWALRCNKSWFNINIFSCDVNNTDYTTKILEFETLLKNTSGLISTTSSFNGLGIYKLKKAIYCRYNATYHCDKCKNTKQGCFEDNDHIGFHKQMIYNNGKIYINNKMSIQTRPENSISYDDFISKIKIKNVNKNILTYLLINNMIDKNGVWLNINVKDGEISNLITNYYDNTLYIFNNIQKKEYTFLNKNIQLINENIRSSCIDNICKNYISFIYINCDTYKASNELFQSTYHKIKEGCIIIFHRLLNFAEYYLHALKAFYEYTQEYHIKFDWLMINGEFKMESFEKRENENQIVAVKIVQNPFLNNKVEKVDYNSSDYDDFDWKFYKNNYNDLTNIQTKEEAYLHWKHYGQTEGRIRNPSQYMYDNNDEYINEMNKFDWQLYLELNEDLREAGIETKEQAFLHWKKHGNQENRISIFDWCLYIKNYNLIGNFIDNKAKAIQHWKKNGRPCVDFSVKEYENELFDWKYYVNNNSDLNHINNPKLAWEHWIHFGKNECRKCHNFNWMNYLLANSDLVNIGIDNEISATMHWIKHGKNENRKIY